MFARIHTHNHLELFSGAAITQDLSKIGLSCLMDSARFNADSRVAPLQLNKSIKLSKIVFFRFFSFQSDSLNQC